MRFRTLTLEQAPLLRKGFAALQAGTCDYSVGGMLMWRDYWRMEYAVEDGTVFTRLSDDGGRVYYNLPLCADPASALRTLMRREEVRRFCTVPEAYVQTVCGLFPRCRVTEERDLADYLYRTEDFIGLKGRSCEGQRNQIRQFLRGAGTWSYAPIDARDPGEAVSFFAEYRAAAAHSDYADEENRMTADVLAHLDEYGMTGGVLKADGRVVGFSLVERIGRTLFVHVEKADRSVRGAYQMLANQTARLFADGAADFIDREEDMGSPGLRRAKLAYRPVTLLKKYTVGELPG